MKKYYLLVISLFVISSLFGVANPIFIDSEIDPPLGRDGSETEVWVDDDYYDADHDGGHEWGVNAFDNLTDALAACVIVTDQDDATDLPLVNVASGEYKGVILTKGARFIGDSENLPILNDPTTTWAGYPIGFVFTGTAHLADYTVIQNFRIDFDDPESSSLPIYLRKLDNLLIENIEIANACQGISTWGCSNSIFRNNLIEWVEVGGQINGGGIAISIGARATLAGAGICNNNIIEDNIINGTAAGDYSFSTPGILLDTDRRGTVVTDVECTGNIIRNNHIFGTYGASANCIEVDIIYPHNTNAWPQYYETGIYDDDFRDNIVEGNECTGNIWGISVYLTKNLIIRDNILVDCNEGIVLHIDNPGIDISYNNFQNCGYNVVLGRHQNDDDPLIYLYHLTDANAMYNWNGTIVDSAINAKMGDGDEVFAGMGSGTISYSPYLTRRIRNYDVADENAVQVTVGPMNASISVTPALDASEKIDIYQYGSFASNNVEGETFDAGTGCNVRSSFVWGVLETGDVSAAISINVNAINSFAGFSNAKKLLYRYWNGSAWSEWFDTGETASAGIYTLTNTFASYSLFEYTYGCNNVAPVIAENNTVINPGSVQLTFEWGSVGDTYTVYSSSDPYAAAGDWNSEGSTSDESFTGSADNLYYRVVEGTRSLGDDASAIIGGVTYACIANANLTSVNVIALPLLPAGVSMASDLGEYIGTDMVNTVSRWDIYSQSWVSASYMTGLGWGGDFALEAGESYMVGVLESGNIIIAGSLPDPADGYLITSETTNANFVMMPLDKNDITTFTDLSNDIDGGTHKVNVINWWNNATQTWTSKSWSGSEWLGTDFDLEIGMPYMFFTTEYVAWPVVE